MLKVLRITALQFICNLFFVVPLTTASPPNCPDRNGGGINCDISSKPALCCGGGYVNNPVCVYDDGVCCTNYATAATACPKGSTCCPYYLGYVHCCEEGTSCCQNHNSRDTDSVCCKDNGWSCNQPGVGSLAAPFCCYEAGTVGRVGINTCACKPGYNGTDCSEADPPPLPTDLNVVTPAFGVAILSWTNNLGDFSIPLLHVNVSHFPIDYPSQVSYQAVSYKQQETGTATFNQLPMGTFAFQVASVNIGGSSAVAGPVYVTISPPAPPTPVPPPTPVSCSPSCSPNGQCIVNGDHGTCSCFSGWTGLACTEWSTWKVAVTAGGGVATAFSVVAGLYKLIKWCRNRRASKSQTRQDLNQTLLDSLE